MDRIPTLVLGWLPDGAMQRLADEFTQCEFIDAREPAALDAHLGRAVVTYGALPPARLAGAPGLKWMQLFSAGVPRDLCGPARERGLTVTNLAGLYGPTIAEHALALMLLLARNLHVALRNQTAGRWDRTVANGMSDLAGKTLAVVGAGNIGQSIARLAKAYGMRVVGCRRTARPTTNLDQVYPCDELRPMLAEADYVAVAAPLTDETEGMLGPEEFAAIKRGAFYVNVSRGQIAEEKALLGALESGHVAGAGLDVFSVEPVPQDHPFWKMPQVILSPHYSGEVVNTGPLPAERFARNLRAWLAGRPLEGVVKLDCGY
jgi:D-2-hydroxyacid dehydrogenase (NADP+)